MYSWSRLAVVTDFSDRPAPFPQAHEPRDPLAGSVARTVAWSPAHGVALSAVSRARLLRRDDLDQSADQAVGVDPLGPGMEIQDQAMAQDRQRDGAHVGEIDMEAAVENGPGLGSQDQVLRCPGAGAIGQELVDPRLGLARDRPRGDGQVHRVADHGHRRPARRGRPAGAGPLRPRRAPAAPRAPGWPSCS